jgi:hypothetical protein
VTRGILEPKLRENAELTRALDLTGEPQQLARGLNAEDSSAASRYGYEPRTDLVSLRDTVARGGLEGLLQRIRTQGYAGLHELIRTQGYVVLPAPLSTGIFAYQEATKMRPFESLLIPLFPVFAGARGWRANGDALAAFVSRPASCALNRRHEKTRSGLRTRTGSTPL